MFLSGHPWILLCTDRTLRTLSIKSKWKSRSPPLPSQLPATTRLEEQNDRRTAYDSFGETTDPTSLPGSLSRKTKEQDDSGARTTSCTYGRTEEQPSLHIVLNKSKRTISKGFMEGLEQWELIVMPGRHLVLISTYFWMVGSKMCNGSNWFFLYYVWN